MILRSAVAALALLAGAANASAHSASSSNGWLASDVRAYGAKCDGSTDDVSEIQDAIDEMTTTGGTLFLPLDSADECMIGGSGLTMKDNVRIWGLGSGTLKAHSTLTDEIIDGGTGTDNWAIEGVRFDLNGKALGAVDIDGQDWRFVDNVVEGGATGAQSAHSLVKLDCAATTRSQCYFSSNRITGSGDATTNDTCLEITGGEPATYGGHGFHVTDNDIHDCGEDGIWLQGSMGGYILANNNIDNIKDVPIYSDQYVVSAGATIQNNLLDGDGEACMVMKHGNIEVSGNHCSADSAFAYVHRVSSVDAPSSNVAGVKLSDNYFATDIWFDSQSECSTTTSTACDVDGDCPGAETCVTTKFVRYDHVDIVGNVIAGLQTCIRAENLSGSVISNNTLLGSKGTDDYGGIHLENPRSDIVSGNNVIAGNAIGIYQSTAAGGKAWCLKWDDDGGGGFESWGVVGNDCGRPVWPAGTERPEYAMTAVGSPSTWTDMQFTGNTMSDPPTFFLNEPSGSNYCNNAGVADTCGAGEGVDTDVTTSDQTSVNTTLANITGLSASLAANTEYTVRAVFAMDSVTNGTDFKVAFDCGACVVDSSYFLMETYRTDSSTGLDGVTTGTEGSAMSHTWGSGTRDYTSVVEGTIEIGATGGTLNAQFAENSSGTNFTLLRGSSMQVSKVQ